jgi:multicomponent Na+:H+ antiporter subunit G
MIHQYITIFFLLCGSFFIFVAALGIVRFPDLYTRIHAASKSLSLGIGFMLLGTILYFGSIMVIIKSIAVVIFIFLTMPIASHMISRAAYKRGVRIWEKTEINEMEKK